MINDVKILFIKFCLYSFTKSSTHFVEIANTFFEIFFREFRPIFINEHNLSICNLIKQKITNSFVATSPDEKIYFINRRTLTLMNFAFINIIYVQFFIENLFTNFLYQVQFILFSAITKSNI